MRTAAWLALCCTIAAASAAPFTFAALGDAPYDEEEEAAFIALIAEINREALAFVVHIGDFKSGRSACTDALYLQRRQWFDLSRHPLIYAPGDNEWTDCWRRSTGSYDPRERLEKLRQVFFDSGESLGQRRIALARQSDGATHHAYPEHARWVHDGVMFVSLNVPGGDNNFARDPEEFRVRDAAVRDWIRASFRLARAHRHAGVFLAMQANPWAAAGARRHGFAPLLEVLAAEASDFPGEVVLIHGDTHRFRVDRPLLHPATRRPLANFTRIEVFGSPSVNWVRVRVKNEAGKLDFAVTPGS